MTDSTQQDPKSSNFINAYLERLERKVSELEQSRDNMLRIIGALVVQSGGAVEVSHRAILEDYTVHEIEDVVTGGIKIRADVYVPCKNDRAF